MSAQEKLMLSEAIARMEGFYTKGSRAQRNNNPGNIEYGEFARNCGASRIEFTQPGVNPRFAYFPTLDDGFRCLRNLLQEHYSGKTIAQAIAKYAPSTENNTELYIKNICDWTGLDAATVIIEDIV